MRTETLVGSEILVTTKDRTGVLSQISDTISRSGVGIKAICGYAVDGVAHVRLITDDDGRTQTALHDAGFDCTQHGVVMAAISPHSMHPEVANYAEGFEVGDDYWCASARSGEHAMLVFPLKANSRLASMK
jgi:hypothetical protein